MSRFRRRSQRLGQDFRTRLRRAARRRQRGVVPKKWDPRQVRKYLREQAMFGEDGNSTPPSMQELFARREGYEMPTAEDLQAMLPPAEVTPSALILAGLGIGGYFLTKNLLVAIAAPVAYVIWSQRNAA